MYKYITVSLPDVYRVCVWPFLKKTALLKLKELQIQYLQNVYKKLWMLNV